MSSLCEAWDVIMSKESWERERLGWWPAYSQCPRKARQALVGSSGLWLPPELLSPCSFLDLPGVPDAAAQPACSYKPTSGSTPTSPPTVVRVRALCRSAYFQTHVKEGCLHYAARWLGGCCPGLAQWLLLSWTVTHFILEC